MSSARTGARVHLQDELLARSESVIVQTRYGAVTGGRATNGAAVFLEVPYGVLPGRFQDPQPLPEEYSYEGKEYVYESRYGAQPSVDGQAAGVPYEDKVGLGKPVEDPLFVNIVSPPDFTPESKYPVKVYIHGGFLQFGSPHGLSGQAQYISTARSEVWVNIGYRLSVFGFLACDEPRVAGNFGFKDQWLALLWVKEHIGNFGGDPANVMITGLSAGAHSVHQLLHHASRLPEGEAAPFQSAKLESNAIVTNPKTPSELRPQFQALCRALGLDPTSPDALPALRDTTRTPASTLTQLIELDVIGPYSTFRGCLDGSWLVTSPDPMTWQRSGALAHALRQKGVRSVVVGDLKEEWYLYGIAHPLKALGDVRTNLERYYPTPVVDMLLALYTPDLQERVSKEGLKKRLGDVAGDGQVHLPVRLFARDFLKAGFPIVRYQIRWTPEQIRPFGYVTHGTDRPLWALRLPTLQGDQAVIATRWLDAVDAAVKEVEVHGNKRNVTEVLALKEDQTIEWIEDERWDELMRLRRALPGEALA